MASTQACDLFNGKTQLMLLEDAARYAGLLLAPAEGFGQGFFALRAKKRAY